MYKRRRIRNQSEKSFEYITKFMIKKSQKYLNL